MNEPKCGWCSLTSTCTSKSTCLDSNLPHSWLQNSDTCPSISNFLPTTPIPANFTQQVSFDVSSIPNPTNGFF